MKNNIRNHYETNPINIIINGTKRAFTRSQQLAILLIIVPFATGIINFIVQIFGEVFGSVVNSNSANTRDAILAIGGILLLLAFCLQVFLQTWFMSLQAFSAVKIVRSEDMPFGTALSEALGKFWKILGATFLIGLYALPYGVAIMALVLVNVIFGTTDTKLLAITIPLSTPLAIFFAVLLIRVYLRFNFATMMLFDGAETITAALEKSKALTRKRLSEVFGVVSLASLVPLINGVTTAGGDAVLYEQLKTAREHGTKLPRQHILNYLALFIAGGFMLFVGLTALLVVIVTHNS